MTNMKTILEVEVDQKQVDELIKKLEKVKSQAKEQKDAAIATTKELSESAKAAGKVSDATGASADNLDRANKAQKQFKKSTDDAAIGLKGLKTSTEGVAKDTEQAASFLTIIDQKARNISAVLAGVVAAGLAVNRIVSGAQNEDLSSKRLGISIGEQRAFGTDFQTALSDPGSFLSKVNAMQHDATKLGAFAALGINPNQVAGMNTADLAIAAMGGIRSKFAGINPMMMGPMLQAFGLGSLADTGDVQQLLAVGNYGDLVSQFGKDRTGLAQNAKDVEQLEKVKQQLDRVGHKVTQATQHVTAYVLSGQAGNDIYDYVPDALGFKKHPDRAQQLAMMRAQFSLVERQQGLPRGLLSTQAQIESGFDPDVIYGRKRSSAGAIGVMQLMPGTAEGLGITAEEAADPNKAIPAAGRLWAQLLTRYKGNINEAAAGYNWKPAKLDALLRNYGGDFNKVMAPHSGLPAETRNYVNKLNAHMVRVDVTVHDAQGNTIANSAQAMSAH